MALQDIYRTLTSKAAQRTLLYAILAAIASSALYGIAAVGYLAFYHEYVPHRVRSVPVHLQYGPALAQFSAGSVVESGFLSQNNRGYHAPYGLADVRGLDLKADQEYDVSVVLSLPHSPANHAVGNFMVELVMSSSPKGDKDITTAVRLPPANPGEFLESQGKRVVFAAARPAILAYTDPLVAQAKRIALLPAHFFAPEAASRERLIVPMAESLEFGELPAVLYVEVRTPGDSAFELQTYGAEVVFSARLRGLRWLMYHHRIFSFVLLTSVSWVVEVGFMAGVFLVLGVVYGGGSEEDEVVFGGKGDDSSKKSSKKNWEASTASSRAPSASVPAIKKEEDVRQPMALIPAADGNKSESAVEKEDTKKQERAESQARISSMLAQSGGSPGGSPVGKKSEKSDVSAKKGKAIKTEEVDDYDSYTDDYSDEVAYEDDVEEPPSPSRKKKTSGIPQSPKKDKDLAVTTGRSSSGLGDTPLRQRQQPQTPKKELSNVSNVPASPSSASRENSARKKAHDEKPARPA